MKANHKILFLTAILMVPTVYIHSESGGIHKFGPLTLNLGTGYLGKGQYVYAEVGNGQTDSLDQVNDFFVLADANNNYGIELSGKAMKAISLVTGAIVTRKGYAGSYLDGYDFVLVPAVEQRSGISLPIALSKRLRQLSTASEQEQAKVRGEIQRIRNAYAQQYPLLGGAISPNQASNLMENILNEPTVLATPTGNLVKFEDKYYIVSPDQTIILDYAVKSIDPATGKVSYIGIMYNALNKAGNSDENSGTPSHALRGHLLDMMRSQAGVIVGAQGHETLGPKGMPLKFVFKDIMQELPRIGS